MIIWGERLSHGARGRQGVAALLALARKLNLAGTDGAGLLEIPTGTNGRGLREVGCLPNLGPGPGRRAVPRARAPRRSPRRSATSSTALVLLTPTRPAAACDRSRAGSSSRSPTT